MIDAADALAFSMHANKGVYAVLLGSGASRAAQIPTGWEITLELVRKVAALEKADAGADPAAWFLAAKGKPPNYSELLDALTKTPSERQQLLRPYWEPSEQEREEGAKLPTKAHRAIAELVKLGYIRVVLTTNFDRLLETALHELGIQPTVLSTPDHIDGALPLIHTPCTIVKIHGDYLDTRIRNTPEELSDYPAQFNKLLDRIFDEFGLIVLGWSADWDEGLRAAITRAPYRRFSTYWASRGDPSEKAADLISRKGATLVKIVDADSFFDGLCEKVKALEESARPHPLSVEAAVASLKKYLSEPRFRISHDDLVSSEVDRLRETTSGPTFDVNLRDVSGPSIERRLHAYESSAEALIRMAFVAGQWAEREQIAPWEKALSKLASRRAEGGVILWLELQRYPATLLLYAFGLGSLQANQLAGLGTIFDAVVRHEHREDKRLVDLLSVSALFRNGVDAMKILPGRERQYTPLNNRLSEYFFRQFDRYYSSQAEFNDAFDRFEVITALSSARLRIEKAERYWAPLGIYGWRHESRQRIFSELRKNLEEGGNQSLLVTSGVVGKTAQQGLENLTQLETQMGKLHWY